MNHGGVGRFSKGGRESFATVLVCESHVGRQVSYAPVVLIIFIFHRKHLRHKGRLFFRRNCSSLPNECRGFPHNTCVGRRGASSPRYDVHDVFLEPPVVEIKDLGQRVFQVDVRRFSSFHDAKVDRLLGTIGLIDIIGRGRKRRGSSSHHWNSTRFQERGKAHLLVRCAIAGSLCARSGVGLKSSPKGSVGVFQQKGRVRTNRIKDRKKKGSRRHCGDV